MVGLPRDVIPKAFKVSFGITSTIVVFGEVPAAPAPATTMSVAWPIVWLATASAV